MLRMGVYSLLPAEHLGVLRELVTDRHLRRRWLGVSEVNVIKLIRRLRPYLARDGVGPVQEQEIEKAFGMIA